MKKEELKQEARNKHKLCKGTGVIYREGGSDPCPRCYRESALIGKAYEAGENAEKEQNKPYSSNRVLKKVPHYRHDVGGECFCSSPHIENERGDMPEDGLKSR